MPKWEDVEGDPEPDLRELLARKKKRKDATAVELDDTPQCVRVRGLDGKICVQIMKVRRAHEQNKSGPHLRVAAREFGVLRGTRKFGGRE